MKIKTLLKILFALTVLQAGEVNADSCFDIYDKANNERKGNYKIGSSMAVLGYITASGIPPAEFVEISQ